MLNKFVQPYQYTELSYTFYIIFTLSVYIGSYTANYVFIYIYKHIYVYLKNNKRNKILFKQD